jgi:hypothetical protein
VNCGIPTAGAKKITPVPVDPGPYQHAGAAFVHRIKKASVIIVLIALGTWGVSTTAFAEDPSSFYTSTASWGLTRLQPMYPRHARTPRALVCRAKRATDQPNKL